MKLTHSVGTVVKPHLDGFMCVAIIELWPWSHAAFQEIPCGNKAIWGFLHTDGPSGHDNQDTSLGSMSHGHGARH